MAGVTLKPTDLVKAAQHGDVEAVELILKHYPAQVDITHQHITALHAAAGEGHTEVMKTLIRNDADLHICDLDYATPLHYAVKNNQKDTVRLLLQSGANMDEKDGFGVTAPQYAFQNKFKDCIKIFQDYNPAVQFKKEGVETPMMLDENPEELTEEFPVEDKKDHLSSENAAEVEEELKKNLCVYCSKNEAGITFEPCQCVVSCFECSLSTLACNCGTVIEKRSYNDSEELIKYVHMIKDLKKSSQEKDVKIEKVGKENAVLAGYHVCQICTFRPLKCTMICGHMYCIPCIKEFKKRNFGSDPKCAICNQQSRYIVIRPEWPTPII